MIDWVDLFTRAELKYLLVDSLDYCIKNKGLFIHAWVIMPSHLHLIVSSENALSNIIRDFKKFTAKEIIKSVLTIPESRRKWLLGMFSKKASTLKRNERFKVWRDGYHPIILKNETIFSQKLDYLHMNPVVDEIVDDPEMYKFSSARDYAGMKGMLPIEFVN